MPSEGRVSSRRLVWEQGQYTSSYGSAGGVRLFTCSYTVDRADIQAGTPYLLSSDLPGYRTKRWKATTPVEAQTKAERVLNIWLDKIAPARVQS